MTLDIGRRRILQAAGLGVGLAAAPSWAAARPRPGGVDADR